MKFKCNSSGLYWLQPELNYWIIYNLVFGMVSSVIYLQEIETHSFREFSLTELTSLAIILNILMKLFSTQLLWNHWVEFHKTVTVVSLDMLIYRKFWFLFFWEFCPPLKLRSMANIKYSILLKRFVSATLKPRISRNFVVDNFLRVMSLYSITCNLCIDKCIPCYSLCVWQCQIMR